MTTAADVVNRTLEFIGSQVQVTGSNPTFDGSVAGNAAGVLYTPAVQLCLRTIDPAFARRTATLTIAVPALAPAGWTYAYNYPTDCLRIRGLRPLGSYNVNDPRPVRGALYYESLLPGKAIAANVASPNLGAVYTTSLSTENDWDQGFLDAVVRRLANPLAMALDGRPDFAKQLLEEAERAALAAELGDES